MQQACNEQPPLMLRTETMHRLVTAEILMKTPGTGRKMANEQIFVRARMAKPTKKCIAC